MRALTIVRIASALGGVLSLALLNRAYGLEGFGLITLAVSALGLTKVVDMNTSDALQALIPVLRGEGAGRDARRVAWYGYAMNVLVCVAGSTVLVLASHSIAAVYETPTLAPALEGIAVWNLLPVLRGPIDHDVALGLEWFGALLAMRVLEALALVGASLGALYLGYSPASYFLVLTALSLPSVAIPLCFVPRFRDALDGGGHQPKLVRRFLRFCFPVTASQAIYRMYANMGAPIVAGLLSVSDAGLYGFALRLAERGVVFLAVVPQAFQPLLARLRAHGREAVADVYKDAVGVGLALAVPACVALTVYAPELVLVIGQREYAGAVPLLQVLALQIMLRTLSQPAARVLYVFERPTVVTIVSAGRLASELALALLLIRPLGVFGVTVAHATAAVPATACLLLAVRRMLGSGAGGVAPAVLEGVGTLAAAWTVSTVVRATLPRPAAVAVLSIALILYVSVHFYRRPREGTARRFISEQLFRGVPLLGRRHPARPEGVTFVTNSHGLGGLEKNLLDLSEGLAAHGVQRELICPREKRIDPWVDAMVRTGVQRVVRVSVEAPLDLVGVASTYRALRDSRGILHFHLNSLDDQAPGMILAALARRRPIVATLQLSRRDRPGLLSPKRLRRAASLKLPDLMLPVAEDLRREQIDVYGRDPARVVTVRNACKHANFARDEGARRRLRAEFGLAADTTAFVFVGRLTRIKGVLDLLEALGRIDRGGHALLVVGDGPQRRVLEARARRDELPVLFQGWRDDVPAVLSAADALVLPSYYEGLPISIAEAMSAGLPVIASRVCGTPEIVRDGETGLLVSAGDPTSLAAALTRFLELRPAERCAMGNNARMRARRYFSMDRQVAETLEQYRRICPEALPPRPTAPRAADANAPPEPPPEPHLDGR